MESPQLIDSSAEELVFSLDEFEGTGWSRTNEEIDANMARREFRNPDEGTQIYATVWYYESVSEAENKYQDLNNETTGTFRTESRDVGTEAFAYESVRAKVVVREVNVVARVEHFRLGTSQSIETATEYASRLRNQWVS